MNAIPAVERDERTLAVENASYRWSHGLLLYALLIDASVRGFFFNQAAWDLLAMVIVSGNFCWFYQWRRDAVPQGRFKRMSLVALISGILAFIIAVAVTLMQK